MKQNVLVSSAVSMLLMLQYAGLSLASETSPQNIDNQPGLNNDTATSPTTDIKVDVDASNATVAELKSPGNLHESQLFRKESDDKDTESDLSVSNTDEDGSANSVLEERLGRLWGIYTTKSKALFVTTTKTALSTCFSATDTACTGRKRRMMHAMVPADLIMAGSSHDDLDTSQNEVAVKEPSYEFTQPSDSRTGKVVTFWTTLFNTFTITTTFYVPGTTMERKALIACVGTLLLLQIAGLSQASGTSPQSIVSQPKNDDVDTNSPTADDSVSDTTAVESNDDPSGGSDAQEGGSEEEEDPDRSGKLIAQYTTKTKALFVTTTLTALSTCFSATDVACTGKKKKKRSMAPRNLFIVPGANAELISSQDPPASGESEYEFKSHDSDREERKFTIWTTLFSTHTLTTTFYYPGTTVSISGVCSVPGLESSCFG